MSVHLHNTGNHEEDDPIVPMPGDVTSHGFASQLHGIGADLHRMRSRPWIFLVVMFSVLDVLLSVFAITLGVFTVAYATHHPYWAQRLAIGNVIVNGMMALLKGESFLAFDDCLLILSATRNRHPVLLS